MKNRGIMGIWYVCLVGSEVYYLSSRKKYYGQSCDWSDSSFQQKPPDDDPRIKTRVGV
jgi:hypothetical protein